MNKSQSNPYVELRLNRINYFKGNDSLVFDNANSRETYFTIHNIREAYEYGKGAGIKVGILDWGFAPNEHNKLYSGYEKFNDSINMQSEHGFWMAHTLKEIAPECEIYALDTYIYESESHWVNAMIKAIDWAIVNKLDILTLSHKRVSNNNIDRFNEAINRAVASNIVTTFIHNCNPNNILPDGLFNYSQNSDLSRKPDVNILHYDYNSIYSLSSSFDRDNLFLSISSTSQVTGGFVAILKSINNSLSPAEYKEILIKTSHKLTVKDDLYGMSEPENVVDLAKAAKYINEITCCAEQP